MRFSGKTAIASGAARGIGPTIARRLRLSRTSIGRWVAPEAVAAVAAVFAGDHTSGMAGQTIHPDGDRVIVTQSMPVQV